MISEGDRRSDVHAREAKLKSTSVDGVSECLEQ